MESHPLAKLFIGVFGLAIVSVAIWFGRSSGNLSNEEPNDKKPVAESPPPEEPKFKRPPISPTGPYPKVKLDEDTHDFSVIVVGSDGSHSFKIQNVGESPLILSKGPTTCKCTISDVTAGEIAPGESATIDLTWKARAVTDKFQQTASIYTNDPDQKEIELVVRGRITQLLEVAPQGVWSVRDISPGKTASVSGSIYSYVLDSMEIGETQVSSDALSYEFEPMTEEKLKSLRAKSGYIVRVTVGEGVSAGAFREKLSFQIANQDIEPIEVYIEGNRSGPITYLASRGTRWNNAGRTIDFGNIDKSQGASGSLLMFVRGLEDTDLEVVSVKSDPPYLECTLKRDERFEGVGRKKYELQFKVPPNQPPVTRSTNRPGVVTIETNHPQAKQLKFRVTYISR